jgi:hypothetical protein
VGKAFYPWIHCWYVTLLSILRRQEADNPAHGLQDNLDSLVLRADLAPLLTLVKAARNGAVYGAKVRFPHALV